MSSSTNLSPVTASLPVAEPEPLEEQNATDFNNNTSHSSIHQQKNPEPDNSTTANSPNDPKSNAIDVWIRASRHRRTSATYIGRLPTPTFTFFSSQDPHHLPSKIYLLHPTTDPTAAREVFDWMSNHHPDPSQQTPLRPSDPHPTFSSLVYLHHACWAYRLRKDIRREDIRDRIYEYVRHGPALELGEVAMVVEILGTDATLVRAALEGVQARWQEGKDAVRPFEGVPQMREIVEYVRAGVKGLPHGADRYLWKFDSWAVEKGL